MSNADKTTMNDRRKELTGQNRLYEIKGRYIDNKEGKILESWSEYTRELLHDVKEYNTQKYARTVDIKV